MTKIQTELDCLKNDYNNMENKNQVMLETVDKLQNESLELKNETNELIMKHNELMMKHNNQQIDIEELAGKA